MEAESPFSPRELRIWRTFSSPSCRPDMVWGDAPNEWCMRPHEGSLWQFPRLCSSSFPLTNSCPSSPRIQRQLQGPLPVPTLPATWAAALLTPLSQLLSEVTRYFGPDDRGVNGSFHLTQMRSCMWMLSANEKTLMRQMQEMVLCSSEAQCLLHSRCAIGKGSLLRSQGGLCPFPTDNIPIS